MLLKCRIWCVQNAASDGSIIPESTFREYFNSPQYHEMIESKSGLGTLTHRSRDPKCNPADFQNIKSTVGKDDSILIVDSRMAAPIWYIEEMYLENGWAWAIMRVLEETGTDESMKEQIRRFKSLIRQGVKPGLSLVVLGYWDNQGGQDVCKKINQIKGADITLNPAQKGARVFEVLEDEDYEKEFSEVDIKVMNSGTPVMKLFSAPALTANLPKTSKIGLKFTELKVKKFSCITDVVEINKTGDRQKTFSVGGLKERLRTNKLSPRQSFRRLILDYKQLVKSQGGMSKMDPEDLKILKSLFTSDILNLLRQIHSDILNGKQISTLLGASTLGKPTRVAAQKLQIPYKLASKEVEKSGFLSKPRFLNLQDSYLDFINSMIDEVFGDNSSIPQNLEDEDDSSNTK